MLNQNTLAFTKKHPFYNLLKSTIILILAVFLFSIPFFYAIIACNLSGSIYVAVRVLRFAVVMILAIIIRINNHGVYTNHEQTWKKIRNLFLYVSGISILLHIDGIVYEIYMTLSVSLGIYNSTKIPLFFQVLWEQLFSGDLYWNILLALTIVFCFPIPRKDIK